MTLAVENRDAVHRYVEAVLVGDSETAVTLARRHLERGGTLAGLFDEVLQPALYEVGKRWEAATITVAEEHLATATTQGVLARVFVEHPPRSKVGRTAVVSCTEGELHSLGARFVADVLEEDGWDVTDLGASTPTSALVTLARAKSPDVVALSTVRSASLPAARDALKELSAFPAPRPLLVVGGRAYAGSVDLARSLGADLFVDELRSLSATLLASLASR